MMHGHDEPPPSEEHKADQAMLTIPTVSGLQRGVLQHPVKLNCHLPLPLPGRVTPEAALLLCTARSGLVKQPPAWHHVKCFPEIQLYFIHFHHYLPAQKAGAYLLAKDFLLGSWRQIILAVSNDV